MEHPKRKLRLDMEGNKVKPKSLMKNPNPASAFSNLAPGAKALKDRLKNVDKAIEDAS